MILILISNRQRFVCKKNSSNLSLHLTVSNSCDFFLTSKTKNVRSQKWKTLVDFNIEYKLFASFFAINVIFHQKTTTKYQFFYHLQIKTYQKIPENRTSPPKKTTNLPPNRIPSICLFPVPSGTSKVCSSAALPKPWNHAKTESMAVGEGDLPVGKWNFRG